MFASGCGVFFPTSDKEPPPITEVWTVHVVRANSVGYVANREKKVTIVLPSGMSSLPDASADVRDSSGTAVWSCTLQGPMTDSSTQSTYYVGDFTPFTSPGTYYIAVPSLTDANGVARSATFKIAPDAYSGLLLRTMLGLHGQRCGTAVSINVDGQSWSHGVCHPGDASQKFVESVMADTIKPSLHGWHDAGDYGKYTTNGAFTVGMLLQAFERFPSTLAVLSLPIPEKDGAMPDFLDEVKWELDWLLTTQFDDGAVSFKVTAPAFENFVMPELDGARRYYTGVSSSATASFAAALAQASRVYRPYDAALADTYLEKARAAYAYLKMHNAKVTPDLSMFATGGYDASQSDADNRAWAAVELWETTGEAAFVADFEAAPVNRLVSDNFDYDNVMNLAVFTYLLSAKTGRDPVQVDAMMASAIASATALATRAEAAPFGRALTSYWWGSNGAVARTSMNLWVGGLLSPADKDRFSDAIAMQLDHLLGRNIYDRTQVTGIGYHPPIRPHHRPSVSDNAANPWPGLLVGGAQPDPTSWRDSVDDASLNEVAINWNAPLIFAAAALVPPPATP